MKMGDPISPPGGYVGGGLLHFSIPQSPRFGGWPGLTETEGIVTAFD